MKDSNFDRWPRILPALAALTVVFIVLAALLTLQRSRRLATRQIFVDSTVWYWHAMGILWILLFALLEFCQ